MDTWKAVSQSQNDKLNVRIICCDIWSILVM